MLKLAAVAAVVISGAPLPAAAQDQLPHPGLSALTPTGPFIVRFDENGNATLAVNGGQTIVLPGMLLPDPAVPQGAGLPLVLTYMLPEPVVAGDVSFAEVPGGPASDWLRFTDNQGVLLGATGAGSRMIFYSDLEPNEPNPPPADKPFPANLGSGNFLAQLEVGPEGNNGFDYRPGGVPYPVNNEYIGISDAIPEPGTYALMLGGLGVLGWVARRRRQS
jgi:hypothetical protein